MSPSLILSKTRIAGILSELLLSQRQRGGLDTESMGHYAYNNCLYLVLQGVSLIVAQHQALRHQRHIAILDEHFPACHE